MSMDYKLDQVKVIIVMGTLLLLAMGAFVTALLFLYRRKYRAHQVEMALLYETHRREILMAQLETQNQTLQRVADDLHDHVGQMLSVVWLNLNRLRSETENLPAQETVDELMTYTSSLVADVRTISKTLSTDTIARFGLLACLELELDRINRARSQQQVELQVQGEAYSLSEHTEIILLRMIQEALNNAIKHASGASIAISFQYKPDNLTIQIIDGGPGFSMDHRVSNTLSGSGQGVHNLRRRAGLLGGTCSWQAANEANESHPGTQVTIAIPRVNTVEEAPPVRL
ncbi:MAG: sensor histidine kinase [Cytophagaceae bacterium]|nr:MAG: sensor histidine kinase [Cytophagaceae bacterium]